MLTNVLGIVIKNSKEASEPMAATTTINSTHIMPSKAAEIYRERTGKIYYVCFHCGFNSTTNSDMLIHIEVHFPFESDIDIADESSHCIDIKSELIEDDTSDVEPIQLEQTFTNFITKPMLNTENPFPDDDTKDLILPHQPSLFESNESFIGLGGLFQWKCLHCNVLFKNSTELREHLVEHNSEQMVDVIDEKKVPMRAHYAFQCTLCSSEYYNARASVQHFQDSHEPAVPLIKCIPSAALLQEHMTVSPCHLQGPTIKGWNSKQIPGEAWSKNCLCTLCDKSIAGTLEFMQHTFNHFDLKIFNCPQCRKNFIRIQTFNAHMRKIHDLKIAYKFLCRFCNDNVDHSNLYNFVTHAFEYHLDDGDRNNSSLDTKFNYHCRFCLKHFERWIDASTHLTLHSEDEMPKELLPSVPYTNERVFSERAKNGAYRSEFLFDCSICLSTLCGSLEARNHLIANHEIADHVTLDNWVMDLAKKKGFKCYDCDCTFDTEIHLMDHRLRHFNILPFACTHCSMSFITRASITRHIGKEHGQKPTNRHTTCKFCKSEFTDDSEFISHNFNEHLYVNFTLDEDLNDLCKYECRYCSEITSERDSMDRHLQTHKNDEISEVVDAESEEFVINKLRHKNEFMYICLRCPKKFRLPFVLKEHAKFVHHDKPNRGTTHCDICSCTFLTWRSLRNHQAKVHPEMITTRSTWRKNAKKKIVTQKPRKTSENSHCDICNTSFLNNRSMINHQRKRHPETITKTKTHLLCTCTICGKAFTDRSNFTKHKETHEKRHSYTCDICGKTYRLKNSLLTHMFVHTKEKNFVCEQCGKSFYTTSRLNLHKQQHENLTFQCDKCSKVFYTRNNFSKHKTTHAEKVRKKCKVCDNTFKSSASLREHMLLHEGTKKHACRYCGLTFAQSAGRRGHEKLNHENV